MAHELDMSNARANMAYVGQTPWHGLGHLLTEGASIDQWTKAAGLDWEALTLPSLYEYQGEVITSPNFHIVRSDTGASLGVMSGRYKTVQPADVMAFFDEFVSVDDRFTLETAGALKGGRVIWALAKFKDELKAGGDAHVPYVFLTTSFDGTLATTAQATMIRVVCRNTMAASLFASDSATVKVPHSRLWTPAVASDARQRLETIAGSFAKYKDMADALAMVRISRDQTVDLFKSLIFKPGEKESGRAKVQFEALFASYVETCGEGTEVGTAWTALNAVTRYVDHNRTTRRVDGASEGEARMASSFFGSGAAMKAKALAWLQEAAA
jgi:phage/plasmid-like protein (TIGR03299 family)